MGENIYILGVCSFITIISFLISIYISIKTKNIDSRIKELKAGTEFNNSREKLVNDLITYQTAIKNISSYKKLRLNLLNDLNVDLQKDLIKCYPWMEPTLAKMHETFT